MTSRTMSPDSWQDDVDSSSQRPPTSSTSDFSEHSLHSRSKSSVNVNSPKRLSMFSRTRSNTANVSSTRQIPTESLTYGEQYTSPTTATHDEKASEKVARSLLVRGSRILRRQGSKLNVIATTLEEEDDYGKSAGRFEVSKVFQRAPKLKKNDSSDQLKRMISEPYNFHHLTHTSSTQFQALDNTSNVELVDEFSAIQASQTPEPGLKGIRAQALHSDDNLDGMMGDRELRQQTSPPTSPLRRSPPVSPREAHSPGRVENFSRPVSRLKSLPLSPTIGAPPRKSSRQLQSDIPEPTTLAIDELLGVNAQPAFRDYDYSRIDGGGPQKTPLLEGMDIPAMFSPDAGLKISRDEQLYEDSVGGYGRITSNFVNSYLSDLDDVAEEKEMRYASNNVSTASRAMPTSRNLDGNTARERSGSAAQSESVIVVQDPQLYFSEEVTSPTLPEFPPEPTIQDSPVSQASDATRRASNAEMTSLPMAWEDDIDYCYEHEAVADCEFDWSRASVDISRNVLPEPSVTRTSKTVSADKTLISQFIQLNAPSMPTTPDLDPGSAHSILTRSQDALTPSSDGASHVGFYNASHSVHDYLNKVETNEIDGETTYEQYLTVDDDSDRQFQFYARTTSQLNDETTSPRSSYSQMSKYHSQESVMLSRAASIVRKHRSSTSTTSVPDLINSANSSRENTIRESIESIERPPLIAMSGEASRPGFSVHRPVKSLGSELSALAKLRIKGSNGSIDVVDVPYPAPSPTHDRTKSASALDRQGEHHALQQSSQGPPFALRQSMAVQKRKSKAGYSLFPVKQ